jgi:hypothetical protein
MNQKLIDKLIENGIKNLQEFGYPSVNKDNILTDMVYSMFFKKMLKESKDELEGYPEIIEAIDYLLGKIE